MVTKCKKIIYIDRANYNKLYNGETVTINGVNYAYDYDAVYYCPAEYATLNENNALVLESSTDNTLQITFNNDVAYAITIYDTVSGTTWSIDAPGTTENDVIIHLPQTEGTLATLEDIPDAVTESTVSGWGFTKNTGTVTSVNNTAPVNGNVTINIPTVPTAGTTASAVGSTASGGSATTWSKSDHVHNIEVSTGDNNGQVKIAGQNVSVKGLGSAAYTNSNTYVPYNGILMNTNPFGGKKLYINSMDNAMYSMDKRYFATITIHNKIVDGVTYPHIKENGAITDDDYWVDSPVVSTYSNPHAVFDGSYENGPVINSSQYLKVHIQFSNEENWSPSTTTSNYPGYPYGTYYLGFYYSNMPGSAEWRCYNTYINHTVGWHSGQFSYFNNVANNIILQATDGGNYRRTCIEFIIQSPDAGSTTLTDIDWRLDRPNISWTSPLTTKFGTQKLYDTWSWGTQNAENLKIFANGNLETHITYPQSNSTYNLGTPSNKWKNIYANYLGDGSNYLNAAYINTIYENGASLASTYLKLAGGVMTGNLTKNYNGFANGYIFTKTGTERQIFFGEASVHRDIGFAYSDDGSTWTFSNTVFFRPTDGNWYWGKGPKMDGNFDLGTNDVPGGTYAKIKDIWMTGSLKDHENNSIAVKDIASKTYVDDAIAAAITTVLSTAV